MAEFENLTPELYLSLLCGEYSYKRENLSNDDGIHLPGPFRRSSDQWMSLLDALAAICVRKEKGDVFFVSLTVELNSVTLYVSSNETVPPTLISHLHKIWAQLKKSHAVANLDPSIPADSSGSSSNPNDAKFGTDAELDVYETICQYSYRKLRRRFLKRAPAILAQYHDIRTSLDTGDSEDTILLVATGVLLKEIHASLMDEIPPSGPALIKLVRSIEIVEWLNQGWQKDMKVGGSESILSKWDKSVRKSILAFHTCLCILIARLLFLDVQKDRKLSLGRLLEKLSTFHYHINTITRIARHSRFAPIFEGQFNVVPIPVAHGDISINFSQEHILPIIFPPGISAEHDIKLAVYDELLKRLQKNSGEEGMDMKKETMPELSMKALNVHAECTLLSYHLQHPEINPYQYFGGSTLSCHGCGLLFNSFNPVAERLDLPQFFTRGWHEKIYLKWPCPSLLSQEQQMSLQPTGSSLDTQVRKEMVAVLSQELAPYVNGLRPDVIRKHQELRERIRKFLETGMCEYKLTHLYVLIIRKIDRLDLNKRASIQSFTGQ